MKRTLDIVVTLTALGVLALPILAIALAVRLVLGRPIFFVQERPGLHGVPFRLIKFRTMRQAWDANGQPLSDADRMTRFGSFLRALSLDELPELISVLKGDMSLVGPRPLLMQYLPLYNPEQARRHEARPGITGWAQVNGRNTLTWEEKFRLDVWYVDHQSLWLDLKILCLTAVAVLRAEGINQQGHATAPEFTGSGAAPSESTLNVPDRGWPRDRPFEESRACSLR
jgi:lipopolysaccharide/colanic/teichoic acid biosynthesis glycosyltransferase